jgi:predicted TIM-barrel fold metal-dependent hydrolase
VTGRALGFGTGASAPSSTSGQEPVEQTRQFWQGLGLPGLFDVHVHFLPPPIQARVYEQFDRAGPKLGRSWPIRYRGSVEERVTLLRDLGVRRFSALPYAHKPGVAGFLNDWARQFASDVPESLWSATFYPEPDAAAYVAELVADGVEVFKIHVQVGDFRLDDPLLDEVWATLEDVGTPIVIHAGSGPVANDNTGPAPLEGVLDRFPRLTAIVAHLGAPEYAEFLTLAETYERVHLDTTMAFTSFFEDLAPFPPPLLGRLADLGDKVLLGSDLPTIPYPYLHQLESLAALDLGEHWLRAVCWENGVRLFGSSRGGGSD